MTVPHLPAPVSGERVAAGAGLLTHADLERALVGYQGDVWDPQRDMAAAWYGSLLCTGFLALARKLMKRRRPGWNRCIGSRACHDERHD